MVTSPSDELDLKEVVLDFLFSVWMSFFEWNEENSLSSSRLFLTHSEDPMNKKDWISLITNAEVSFLEEIRKKAKKICFRKVLVGTPFGASVESPGRGHSRERCNRLTMQVGFANARSNYFWAYRNYLLQRIFGNSFVEVSPKFHGVTLLKGNTSTEIENLEEIKNFVEGKYGNEINVQLVEIHKMEFKKQVELMLKTTLLVSASSQFSSIALFLPHGASLILTDLPGLQNDGTFTSEHKDAHIWGSLFWLNPLYYPLDSTEELICNSKIEVNRLKLSKDESCSLKPHKSFNRFQNACNVIVDIKKLDYLLQRAFFRMKN